MAVHHSGGGSVGAGAGAGAGAPRALVSVSDKAGLADLARGLTALGFEVVSTGGSARAVADAGVPCTAVDDVTGFPEMLGGRVKTLHPKIHGGILAKRSDASHRAALEEHGIGPIDVVVCNLYPFKSTVSGGAASRADAVENIDIGGPSMIRAAAKNHEDVVVVTDPADYPALLEHLGAGGAGGAEAFRRRMAWKAFQHCSTYDSAVAEWLWEEGGAGDGTPAPERTVAMELVSGLRYGENPHQGAAFYRDLSLSEDGAGGLATATQHHGKEMSYNNYLDSEAAYATVMDLPSPGCVVVKHTNPCGAAEAGEGAAAGGPEQLEAYRQAVRADPVSAFGGVVAFNHEITAELAREIREFRSPTDGETRMFYEIVVAPSYTPEGLEVLKGKSKNLRILEAPPRTSPGVGLRQVGGGWLMQEPDSLVAADIDFVTVSEAQPSPEQLADLRLAWTLVKHVKSNAIAIAKGNSLLGMGSGQPNRVKSVEIALEKAGDAVQGAAMASDAFFPFSWGDSVEKACEAGVKIIAHPGGSIRDQDAIDCCNKYGVVLCTTGVRHFRH